LSDPASVYGMQEVWGSSPHSSTSQFKALNSDDRCEAAFLFCAYLRPSSARGESANEQVRAGAIVPRFVLRDLLHCRQAALE
jgi:hypothetical protein